MLSSPVSLFPLPLPPLFRLSPSPWVCCVCIGGEDPITKTKAWQKATEEYARENKINPISGISSEGYKGPGFEHLSKD